METKRSRWSSAHSISALQILCVFLKSIFWENKLCDSHLPYPATTAALSPQTPSDSTTSSLHGEDGSHLSGIHNQIPCLLNTHGPSPNQNALFSTNLKSGSWNISTVSYFIFFIPLTVHSISLTAATKIKRGKRKEVRGAACCWNGKTQSPRLAPAKPLLQGHLH